MTEFEHVEAYILASVKNLDGIVLMPVDALSQALKVAYTAGQMKGLKMGEAITLEAIDRADRKHLHGGRHE